ncbi:unnamed protein product [Phytophthora fragariaefolia]|uniref:Unnamed protein product n=1 Tax=Phytophthora fragariaefolia TaxID=1490495 RepID=A0A9W6XD15_9STRA|nr:unnamed protein product [Phytophthora fragariaefolia]
MEEPAVTNDLDESHAYAAEDILDNAGDAFRLTVGLRRIRGGDDQTSAEHREDGRPELARETGVSIGVDCLGKAVLSEYAVEKQRSCTLTINGVWHSREVSNLAQSVTKTTTPVLPAASGGRPNTKSILMDFQHPEGTGNLASGAAACGAGLTRWHVSHMRT